METYVSVVLDRSAYFLIATTSGGTYPYTDEPTETQINKYFRVTHIGCNTIVGER